MQQNEYRDLNIIKQCSNFTHFDFKLPKASYFGEKWGKCPLYFHLCTDCRKKGDLKQCGTGSKIQLFGAKKCATLDKKEPHFSSDYPQFGL